MSLCVFLIVNMNSIHGAVMYVHFCAFCTYNFRHNALHFSMILCVSAKGHYCCFLSNVKPFEACSVIVGYNNLT